MNITCGRASSFATGQEEDLCLETCQVGTAATKPVLDPLASYADSYAAQGFAGPIPLWSPDEARELLGLFNRLEAEQEGGRFPGQAHNLHLTDPEVWKWVSHPKLTAFTERVGGLRPGSLHIFASTFVTKYPTAASRNAAAANASAAQPPPAESSRFGWHQDILYWDISPPVSLASWVAIDRVAGEASGCVRFQPGRHEGLAHEHVYLPDADHMLLSKKEIASATESIAEEGTACMALEPGEMSVHGGWTPHGSGPNVSPHRRAGLVVNYMLAEAELQPSREGYGPLDQGALIEEFRIPVDPADPFPPKVLQSPPVHEKWRR